MQSAPTPNANDNSIFQFINDVLKRDVLKGTKNETNLEVGDKITSKDGTFNLEVESFVSGQEFPVIFESHGGADLLEDKKIVKTGGDFHDESAEYVLTDKVSTTEAPTTKSSQTSTTTTTTTKAVKS